MKSHAPGRRSEVDYLIIGAGIAGMTAHHFLESDSVALLDPRPERYKIGESLVPQHFVPLELRPILEEIRKSPGSWHKRGILFVSDTEVNFFHSAMDAHLTVHMDRAELEAIYRQQFDPPIRRERVLGLDLVKKEVRTDQHTYVVRKQIIDCSGPAMILARHLGLTEEMWPVYSTWAYWDIERTDDPTFWASLELAGQRFQRFDENNGRLRPEVTDPMRPASEMTMLTRMRDGVWCWQIPICGGKQLSLGIVSRHGAVSAEDYRILAQKVLGPQYVATLRPWDNSSVKNKVHHRNRFAWYSKTFSSPDWVLVGDAAFFGDPVYSVGTAIASSQAIRASQLINHLDWEAGAWQVYEERTQGLFKEAREAYEDWYGDQPIDEQKVASLVAGRFFNMLKVCAVEDGAPNNKGENDHGQQLLAMLPQTLRKLGNWNLTSARGKLDRLEFEWNSEGGESVCILVELSRDRARCFRSAGPFSLSYRAPKDSQFQMTQAIETLFEAFALACVDGQEMLITMLAHREGIRHGRVERSS